jgi:hypothetical protein
MRTLQLITGIGSAISQKVSLFRQEPAGVQAFFDLKAPEAALEAAAKECDRRSEGHAFIALVFGVLFVIGAGCLLCFLFLLLLFAQPQKNNPVLLVAVPTVGFVLVFLSSLSKYHLRLMSRWDDYAIAFARLELVKEHHTAWPPEVRTALLKQPYALVGEPPDFDPEPIAEFLKSLVEKGR